MSPNRVVQRPDGSSTESGDSIDRLLRVKQPVRAAGAARYSPGLAQKFLSFIQGNTDGFIVPEQEPDTDCNTPAAVATPEFHNAEYNLQSPETSSGHYATAVSRQEMNDGGEHEQFVNLTSKVEPVNFMVLPRRYDGTTCCHSYKLHFMSCT